jgi:hypothetical protein
MAAARAVTVATMTERSLGTVVVTAAAALFCAVLIFLALQVRAGRDPAIGAAKPQAARQVIVRRIVVRRVVEDDAPAPAAPSAPPAASVPAAPAPAPAPVVSRGS